MKKGFTLIELMAVITVLVIILSITFPVVSNVLQESRENSYDSQVSMIESAAKRYISDNVKEVDESGNLLISREKDNFVTILALQKNGYLNSKKIIKNPITDRTMTGCVVAAYAKTYNQFQYVYTDYNCNDENVFTPKINISENAGNYSVTITYPSSAVTLSGTGYTYKLSTNNNTVAVSGNSVSGINVPKGTKITAQIKKGEYVIREITEIA